MCARVGLCVYQGMSVHFGQSGVITYQDRCRESPNEISNNNVIIVIIVQLVMQMLSRELYTSYVGSHAICTCVK